MPGRGPVVFCLPGVAFLSATPLHVSGSLISACPLPSGDFFGHCHTGFDAQPGPPCGLWRRPEWCGLAPIAFCTWSHPTYLGQLLGVGEVVHGDGQEDIQQGVWETPGKEGNPLSPHSPTWSHWPPQDPNQPLPSPSASTSPVSPQPLWPLLSPEVTRHSCACQSFPLKLMSPVSPRAHRAPSLSPALQG